MRLGDGGGIKGGNGDICLSWQALRLHHIPSSFQKFWAVPVEYIKIYLNLFQILAILPLLSPHNPEHNNRCVRFRSGFGTAGCSWPHLAPLGEGVQRDTLIHSLPMGRGGGG